MNATWPADRFYWSVMDLPGWTRFGVLPPSLWPELQNDVPIPVEELHAVCTPIHSDSLLEDGKARSDARRSGQASCRVLVCAARQDDLMQLQSGTLQLTPSHIPEYIERMAGHANVAGVEGVVSPGPAAMLNLLVGDFEPRPLSRRRLLRHLELAAAVLLCTGFIALGLFRRAESYRSLTAATIQAGADGDSHRPIDAHLAQADLARLVLVREAVTRARPPTDASLTLAALLRSWPMQTMCVPQSVTISPSSVTVSVTTEEDPAAFIKAIATPSGWKLEEPRINSSGGVQASRQSRIMLEFRPVVPPAGRASR